MDRLRRSRSPPASQYTDVEPRQVRTLSGGITCVVVTVAASLIVGGIAVAVAAVKAAPGLFAMLLLCAVGVVLLGLVVRLINWIQR